MFLTTKYKTIATFVFMILGPASVFVSCADPAPPLNDKESFSKICEIFQKALKNNDTLTIQQKSVQITKRIESTNLSKNAKDSFFALVTVEPEKKYGLFKSFAEEYSKASWECKPMKEFMEKTTELENQP